MNKPQLDVKIVKLEPLRVACVNGYGSQPEDLAFQKMRAFVHANGLDSDGQTHRYFGFNHPDPSPGSPNYGYDVWVTVDERIQGAAETPVFDFPGGLYAVLRIRPSDGEDIFKNWQKLVAWRERSKYRPAYHQWLEEHIGDPGAKFPDQTLDLYIPIAE